MGLRDSPQFAEVHPSVHLYGALDNWRDCAVWWHERAGEVARENNRLRDRVRELEDEIANSKFHSLMARRWRR